ncbi:MAG: alpha/beta hydrolase [Saprospiraceae bacterium]|nr:alpha/beta hydrolase [Saprospiraceae bacterium]
MDSSFHQHRWIAPKQRAVLFVLHGIFEHGGRYEHFASYLNAAGISVLSFDYRGHGRSPGEMGYIESWSSLVNDINDWVQWQKTEFDNLPQFIFGHSLGGLLLVDYLSLYRPSFNGVILSSAALKVKEDLSPLLQKIAPIMAKIAPKLKTIKLDPGLISRDPAEVEKYRNDRLIYHGRISAQTGNETLQASKTIEQCFPGFDWPVLVLHGSDDGLTEPEGSRVFYEQIASDDKTLKLYEEYRHELLNELGREVVLEDIRDWMTRRI